MRTASSVLCILILASQAWAWHPLITDDPGTVARGRIQLEQTFDITGAGGLNNSSTTLNYGVSNNVEAGIDNIYYFTGNSGLSQPSLSLIWRFVGSAGSGLSIALSSSTTFDTNPFISEQIAVLLGQYTLGNTTYLLNAGHSWIVNGQEFFDWGLAVQFITSSYNALALEATNSDFLNTDPGVKELEYLIGAVYTDSRQYAYSTGIGYLPNDDTSKWRLTMGITITF